MQSGCDMGLRTRPSYPRSWTITPTLSLPREGERWRVVMPTGAKMRRPTMCFEPVAWVGRWKFLKGWTKVWSCDRHTDELVGGRHLPEEHFAG